MLDHIEKLVTLFEHKQIDRRQLLAAILAASAVPIARGQAPEPVVKGRILNHLTLSVTDVGRSRGFYEKLLGATLLLDGSQQKTPYFDLRVGNSFVSVMKGEKPGMSHFCVGVDGFDASSTLARLQKQFPESNPRVASNALVKDPTVYLRDPDGMSVQLAATRYELDR